MTERRKLTVQKPIRWQIHDGDGVKDGVEKRSDNLKYNTDGDGCKRRTKRRIATSALKKADT